MSQKKATVVEKTYLVNVRSKTLECAIANVGGDFGGCSRGRALCSENDVFDERKGRAIAGARADLKIQRKLEKTFHRASEELEKALDEARMREKRYERNVECIEKSLAKLTR